MKSYIVSTSCDADDSDYEKEIQAIRDSAQKKEEKLHASLRERERMREEYFPRFAELSRNLLKDGKLQVSFFKVQLMNAIAPTASRWNEFSALVDDFIRCNSTKQLIDGLFVIERGKDGGISLNAEYL